jgi:hypothetical protein
MTTTDHAAHLTSLRKRRAELGEELAHAEFGGAARIIVAEFPTADQLLIAQDVNDHDHIDIVPLVLFDDGFKLLWFNGHDDRYDSRWYPGADKLQDGRGRAKKPIASHQLRAITEHLIEGYDAAGGCSGALAADTADEYFGFDVNVLTLNIPAALAPWEPSGSGS